MYLKLSSYTSIVVAISLPKIVEFQDLSPQDILQLYKRRFLQILQYDH